MLAGTCTNVYQISNGATVNLGLTGAPTWVGAHPITASGQFAKIDGQANAVSFDPTTALFGATLIAVTPTALDAVLGVAGFGGRAIWPLTGSRFAPRAV